MNKIYIFDADGVTIKLREKYFSQRLLEDYGISPDLVIPLFKNEFYKCTLGVMDLFDVLKNYLPIWNWKGSIDDLLQYWWQEESTLNTELLEEIIKFRQKGIKCYLATDQEKYRADYLMQKVGLNKYLDGAFFSSDLGISKSRKEFWIKVLEQLGKPNPEEVYFFDDEKENFEAAKEVGIRSYLFKDINNLRTLLN